MNFFICNRYDSKREDIHIITSKIPDNKNKISYYKYDHNKNLNLVKTIYLNNNGNEKNNVSEEIENSDELQIIEYPYQPNQGSYNLNTFYSNKIKTNNSLEDNNSRYFNCYNQRNNNESFYEKKILNEIKTLKHSFSCLSNSNLENSIKDNFYLKNSELNIEDTIKGEDNINITKLKMRNKKIQRQMHNIKNIPNHIFNKNRNKSPYISKLLKYDDFNINKISTKNDFNKKIIITEINKKSNDIKRKQLSKSPKNKVIDTKNNNLNKNSKNKTKTNINIDSKLNKGCKNNFLCDNSLSSSYLNSSKNNKRHNLISSNFKNNNFLIDGYKQKEVYNNKKMNDNKKIIDSIKKKIKKDMINYKYKKNDKFIENKK